MYVREIMSTHPDVRGSTADALLRAIGECLTCAQTCIVCADACLAEDMVTELRQCIRLNQDCADLCLAAATTGARRSGRNVAVLRPLLTLCASACRACAEECQGHATRHEHCRICAETCQSCAEACDAALAEVH